MITDKAMKQLFHQMKKATMSDTSISFEPVSGAVSPRFAGVPTFMRLPNIALSHPDIAKVDIGLVGVPWDAGTTNRPGARHGPRQLRDLSTMIRAVHPYTGVNPFKLVNCADLGRLSGQSSRYSRLPDTDYRFLR
jgi:guanidinopropionase